MNNLFQELKCPNCKNFFDSAEHLPLVITQCGHNICKECFDKKKIYICAIDNKRIDSTSLPSNNVLADLISTLPLSAMNFDEDEEIITMKIEVFNEYITMINENFQLFEKDLKKNKMTLVSIKKYANKKEGKKLDKFKISIKELEEIEKLQFKIIQSQICWKENMKSHLDKMNTNLFLPLPSSEEDTFSKEGSALNDECENLLKKLNEYNEKMFKFKQFKKEMDKIEFQNHSTPSRNILKIPKSTKKERLKSFSNPFVQTEYSSSSNNTNTTYNEKNNSFDYDSFLSNPVSPFVENEKEINKDTIVFLKNKLKSEIINCSGYSIGNEGCKILVTIAIKSNLNCKKEGMVYKELRLAKCNISEDGLNYINTFLDLTKKTITSINLSKNNIDDDGINLLISILKKNVQLREFKLSRNLFSEDGKKKIVNVVNDRQLKVKIEI